jgi:hypothetical protein
MDRSPSNYHDRLPAAHAASDDPTSDADDDSGRGSFDNQAGEHGAGRQRSATEVPTESVSFESQQRRRMTDPLPGYVLQSEEIDIEPLPAVEIQFPTTAQFERGVKLSRRATYTPLFAPQFHSSMSLKGIADPYRRASVGSRVDVEPQSEKLEFDRYQKPDSPTDRRWTPSKPVKNERAVKSEKTPAPSNQSDAEASSSTKASRRSRLSASVGRWFK